MLKRILAIVMVVALLGTAFVVPVSGVDWPVGDQNKTIFLEITNVQQVEIESRNPTTNRPILFYNNQYNSQPFTSSTVTFDVPDTSTVWIGAYNNAGTWYPDPNYDVGALTQYYDQSASYEGSLIFPAQYTVNPYNGLIVSSTANASAQVFVACFRDVPAGTYTYTYSTYTSYVTCAIFIDENEESSGGGDCSDNITIDGTVDVNYPMGEERYSLWLEALEQLAIYKTNNSNYDLMLSYIDIFSSYGDLLGLSMAQYLIDNSTASAYIGSVLSEFFQPYLSLVFDEGFSIYDILPIEDFFSFITSIISEIGQVFINPEDVLIFSSLLSYYYNIFMYLYLFDDGSGGVIFDNPITDEDKEEFTTYEEKESELISLFNLEQYKTQIQLNNYLSSISSGSTVTLRSWLDYMINDSFFKPFISLPVMLLLVTSILGTSIVILRRRSRVSGGDD